jgi:hypothetical protein
MTEIPPHFCTVTPRPDGTRQGCPDWPLCVSAPPAAGDGITVHRRPVVLDSPHDTAAAGSTLGEDMATLAGWAAGAVIVLVVAAILLPFLI